MKAYEDKLPVLVVGGKAGSFLGEYQAGGVIVVLGLAVAPVPVGYFCGTGMHGGVMYLRCNEAPRDLPAQVVASLATQQDMAAIQGYIETYCAEFGVDIATILPHQFYVLRPDTKKIHTNSFTRIINPW